MGKLGAKLTYYRRLVENRHDDNTDMASELIQINLVVRKTTKDTKDLLKYQRNISSEEW